MKGRSLGCVVRCQAQRSRTALLQTQAVTRLAYPLLTACAFYSPTDRTEVADKRKDARIPVSRRGSLAKDHKSFACLIQDINSRGLYMVCDSVFVPGDTLQLSFETYPGERIDATVEVRHADEFGVGALITCMDQKATSAYLRFLDDHYAQMLGRCEQARALA